MNPFPWGEQPVVRGDRGQPPQVWPTGPANCGVKRELTKPAVGGRPDPIVIWWKNIPPLITRPTHPPVVPSIDVIEVECEVLVEGAGWMSVGFEHFDQIFHTVNGSAPMSFRWIPETREPLAARYNLTLKYWFRGRDGLGFEQHLECGSTTFFEVTFKEGS